MKTIKNEKGVALLIVLILSVIILAMSSAMIYMATQGTRFSGMQKTYKTALEASIGGAEMMEHLIISRSTNADNNTFVALLGTGAVINTPDIAGAGAGACTGQDSLGTAYDGIMAKIRTPTLDEAGIANWSAGCDTNMSIDIDNPASFDLFFSLGTAPNEYNVYAKIVNTVEGNTVLDLALTESGVVQAKGAFVPHLGYLYSIEVLSVADVNPRERAKISVLYEY